MDEEKLRKRIARAGKLADAWDGDGGLENLFEALDGFYFEQIMGTEIDDTAGREALYHRASAARDLRRSIEAVITDGKSASAQAAADRRRQEKRH